MTEITITALPAAPLHALELWGNPAKAVARIKKSCDVALPAMGRAVGKAGQVLIRFEPTVWLIEGDASTLSSAMGHDGALTAIGDGVIRVQLQGSRWRRLLMEGGVFDAENPAFAPGCCAATVIDGVNVRLHVTSADACIAYVPASYAAGMIQFWEIAAQALD